MFIINICGVAERTDYGWPFLAVPLFKSMFYLASAEGVSEETGRFCKKCVRYCDQAKQILYQNNVKDRGAKLCSPLPEEIDEVESLASESKVLVTCNPGCL